MKKIFLFIVGLGLLPAASHYCANDFQLWVVNNIEKKSNPRYKAALEEEFRFKHHAGKLGYAHVQPSLLFQVHNNYYAGALCRIVADTTATGQWNQQIEVGPLFFVSGKMGPYSVECRAQLYQRILELSRNHSAIRLRPGITLFSDKYSSFYIQNEFFYNHNNFQCYDRNRFSIGLKTKLFSPAELSLYYLRQDDRPALNLHSQGTHVLGLSLTISF